MAILPILQYPDPRLKLRAQPVVDFDENLRTLVSDMFETMYAKQGIGLAATQVNRQVCVFVMDLQEAGAPEPLAMINPEITASEGEVVNQEGCLSFPGVYANVRRFSKVDVAFMDTQGISHNMSLTGLAAICVQHEFDHLQGITFFDHLSSLKQSMLRKKLQKNRNKIEN